ncbi:MAG TPA: RNA polymerase sigma-70 factor [Bacteroidales bacterium]|nr:RNA polymerase sigma-70 factor [Bacteroidales bacterium]
MKYIEESYLLEKLKEGDIHALEVIFNRHYGSLCKYLFLLFKNHVITDHIAQDIFVYLWENRETIDIKVSLDAYLYSAGRYKALNQIRNAKKQESILKELGSAPFEEPFMNDQIIETEELKKIIEETISTLPERCQQIFRLSREDDMSYRDIAMVLGLSVNTVENQMAIALRKLRKLLRPFYFKVFVIPQIFF